MIVLSTYMKEWAAFPKQLKLQHLESIKFSEQEIITVKTISYLIFRSNKSLITQLKYVRKTTLKKYGKLCWTHQSNCTKSILIHNYLKTKFKFSSLSMVKLWKILHQIVQLNTLFICYKLNTIIWTWVAKWQKRLLTF